MSMSGFEAVSIGDTKRFECQVIAFPLPTITWYKDDVEITNNPRYKVGFTSAGVISLLIENVKKSDAGLYRCQATNSEGNASTCALLIVRDGGVELRQVYVEGQQSTAIQNGTELDIQEEEITIKKTVHTEESSVITTSEEGMRKREETIIINGDISTEEKVKQDEQDSVRARTDVSVDESTNSKDESDGLKIQADVDVDEQKKQSAIEALDALVLATSEESKGTKDNKEDNLKLTTNVDTNETSVNNVNDQDDNQKITADVDIDESNKKNTSDSLRITADVETDETKKKDAIDALDALVSLTTDEQKFHQQDESITAEIIEETTDRQSNEVTESHVSETVTVNEVQQKISAMSEEKSIVITSEHVVESSRKEVNSEVVNESVTEDSTTKRKFSMTATEKHMKVTQETTSNKNNAGFESAIANEKLTEDAATEKITMQASEKMLHVASESTKESAKKDIDVQQGSLTPVEEKTNFNFIAITTEEKSVQQPEEITEEKKMEFAIEEALSGIVDNGNLVSHVEVTTKEESLIHVSEDTTVSQSTDLVEDNATQGEEDTMIKELDEDKRDETVIINGDISTEEKVKQDALEALKALADVTVDESSTSKDDADGLTLQAEIDVDEQRKQLAIETLEALVIATSEESKGSSEEDVPEITVETVTKPCLVEGPGDITVKEGETITITCKISGIPPPEVCWFKHGELLKSADRVSVTHKEDTYTITIINARGEDTGEYTLTATNPDGNICVVISVHVEEEEKKVPEEDLPEFISKPASGSVLEFDNIKYSVVIKGDSDIVIKWFKDGSELKHGFHVKMYTRGERHYLEIPHASLADSGEFTVTAENSAGAIFHAWNLVVHEEAIEDTGTEAETTDGHTEDIGSSTADDLAILDRLENQISAELSKMEERDEDGMLFKEFIVIESHMDVVKNISFDEDDVVEVMDTDIKEKWLVRKQDEKNKIGYIPVSKLRSKDSMEKEKENKLKELSSGLEGALDQNSLKPNELESPEKSPESRRRGKLSRSPSKRLSSTEKEDSDEDLEIFGKSFPVYVAISDYTPPASEKEGIKLTEGQFVCALDTRSRDEWLVRTKPSKLNPAKQGWVPSSVLEKKEGGGHVDRRSTREVVKEDIIQITNKNQESMVKRRYTLTELIETERDFVKDVEFTMDNYHKLVESKELPQELVGSEEVIFGGLPQIYEFHNENFLQDLTQCTSDPSSVGKTFIKWKDEFEKSIPYVQNRNPANTLLDTDQTRSFFDEYNRSIGSPEVTIEQSLNKPVARLERYQVLLKDFVRYTSRAGEETQEIDEAIKMLANVLREGDDQYLLSKIDGLPGDLQLGQCIRHEDLLLWDTADTSGRGKERVGFLLDDKLLLVKRKKPETDQEGPSFQFKSVVDINDIQLNDFVLDDEKRFELWYATSTSEKITFQAINVYSKHAWCHDIRKAMKKLGIDETDIPVELQEEAIMRQKSPPVASPKKRSPPAQPKIDEASESEGGFRITATSDTNAEEYFTMDSYDSDVSSYHTATEMEEQGKPMFKQKIKKLICQEGETARFECVTFGQPQPEVQWQTNRGPVETSDAYQCENKGDEFSLTIKEVNKEDAGLVTVKATNKFGSATCNAELTVIEAPVIERSVKPEFTETIEDLPDVAQGTTAEFKVKVNAFPDADISWCKDDVLLKEDESGHFTFSHEEDVY
ncbi:unnamed protein product, partial [Owenia fusiformis]